MLLWTDKAWSACVLTHHELEATHCLRLVHRAYGAGDLDVYANEDSLWPI